MKADVAILGGGIIGCALADELARRHRRVIVIEQGRIGLEASSAAAGILASQMDIPTPGPFFDLCQAAHRAYPGWIRSLERRTGLEAGLHGDGILYVATSRQALARMRSRARWQRRCRLAAEELSGAAVRRLEPHVDGRIAGGVLFPRESQIDNQALMGVLAEACRRSGVTLKERTAVRKVIVTRGATRGVETDHGRITAPVVVNCLGSWADMSGRFPVRLPVEPARGQILAFRGPRGLFRSAVMGDDAYVVQRRDGRLLVGSTIERAGFSKQVTAAGILDILSGICQLTSAISACAFETAWAGFRPRTPDGLPLIGPTRVSGLYAATGHFRHGILLAPVTATLLADLLLDGRASGLAPFSPARFRA